jgi:putative transposon-encoded protein
MFSRLFFVLLLTAILCPMEILDKLFGSASKVKIMKLFIFNPDHLFDSKAVTQRARLTPTQVRKELTVLTKIGLIKQKGKSGHKIYSLNEAFPYIRPLKELMTHTITISYDDIVKKIGRTCKLKSVVLSGLFINQLESRVDMLIIGNQFNRNALTKCMKNLEAEIGKELSYAILETEDFKYRVSVGDRLVRDILEYPHQIAYDRLGLSLGLQNKEIVV